MNNAKSLKFSVANVKNRLFVIYLHQLQINGFFGARRYLVSSQIPFTHWWNLLAFAELLIFKFISRI